MPTRTTVYIDGFNFYHGLKEAMYKLEARWQRYYWLDFVRFSELLLDTDDELVCVKYFTAEPIDDEKKRRQSALFKANKYLNGDKFEIIKGKYYKKKIKCKGSCKEKFLLYEEKRTDVNISVHMMGDCAFGRTDKVILISADSDLMPPLEFILGNYGHIALNVFFPPCRLSSDIKSAISNCQSLTTYRPSFEKAIMPEIVASGSKSVNMPSEWVYSPVT